MVDTYIEDQQINPLTAEDRKLLSDLSSTFDLGTQTIIKLDEEDGNDWHWRTIES